MPSLQAWAANSNSRKPRLSADVRIVQTSDSQTFPPVGWVTNREAARRLGVARCNLRRSHALLGRSIWFSVSHPFSVTHPDAFPAEDPSRSRGFTLVELLVVVFIIAILVAMLMPALSAARRAAQSIQCASNVRQLTTALINYSTDWNGRFPPNSAEIEQYWFDDARIGRYIKSSIAMPDRTIAGGVLVCPGDEEGAIRSYSMNFFASSYVSSGPAAEMASSNPPGKLFHAGAKESSSLILVIEAFSSWDAPGHEPSQPTSPFVGYTSNAIVGFYNGTAGQRFGADGGAPFPGGRFGNETECQVCYFRHRNKRPKYLTSAGWGRVNIGFLDGHVATFAHDDLADFKTGESRFVALWSPIDREIK